MTEGQNVLPPLWVRFIAIFLVLFIAVIAPRLAALGDFIHMDEGYHAFMARYIQQSYAAGLGFPREMTGYKLYPHLFFWVWSLPGNAVVWLRLIDMVFATAAAWVFCILLVKESKNFLVGVLLALPFLIGINLAGAIDSGFKNSFSPAFLCLFSALLIAKKARLGNSRWFVAGALTALGILFRETFLLFPIIACLALLLNKQWQALWRYICGGIATAVIITLLCMIIRGQIWGIFEFYFTYGKIYGPEEARRLHKFFSNGLRAVIIFAPMLVLFFLALFHEFKNSGWRLSGRAVFWLACALAPLVEPYLKIGFLYHFSACLPGMAGFCACSAATLEPKRPELRKVILTLAGIGAVIMVPWTMEQYHKIPITNATLSAWPMPGWPAALINQSTTLEAAQAIDQLTPPGGTASSTGFAYFVFPPSQVMPPKIALGDLSRAYIYSGEDPQKFVGTLNLNPPDVVLLSFAMEDHSATFAPELQKIFDAHPDYAYVRTIEPDLSKNYGWLGYHIYKKTNDGPRHP